MSQLTAGRKKIEEVEAELVPVGSRVLDASGQDFIVVEIDAEDLPPERMLVFTVESVSGKGDERWSFLPDATIRVRREPKGASGLEVSTP
jgi:hypothetical protein